MRFRGLGRRQVREQTRKAGPSLAEQVAAILEGGSWFEAADYAESGGNVVSFADKLDPTHVLTLTGTLPVPTASSTFQGALAATFTGSQYATSNRPPSSWTFLHNGLGAEMFVVFAPTEGGSNMALQATRTASGLGCLQWMTGESFAAGYDVYDPAVPGLTLSALAGTAALNVPTYFNDNFFFAWEHRVQGALHLGGGTSSSPNPGSPAGPLTVGALVGGGMGARMQWWGSLIARKRLSNTERAVVQSYIASKTGIAP